MAIEVRDHSPSFKGACRAQRACVGFPIPFMYRVGELCRSGTVVIPFPFLVATVSTGDPPPGVKIPSSGYLV